MSEAAAAEALGIAVPEILLPALSVDLSRWAVIACDQYTSQPEYWNAVAERVGDAPSTLHLILPEVWLGAKDEDARIAAIQANMREYLATGVFAKPLRGFVAVERSTPHVASRRGLMVALDLERYDWRPGARALLRATEATVEERLPPRLRVREAAVLELPHVLVLVDDPGCTVIEPVAAGASRGAPLYDVELMDGAGRVRGWAVADPAEIARVERALAALAQPALQRAKYGASDGDPFLYASGDGNHSLAAAKLFWERRKPSLPAAQRRDDPARFALVELVNVHDPGLRFEPIHRVVFGADPDVLLADLARTRGTGPAHALRWVASTRSGVATLHAGGEPLAVAALQAFLDEWLAVHPGARIDYIHGDDALARLSAEPGRIGFTLPAFEKSALFPTVARRGVLPRKAFSLGEAEEKRFYLEARRIRA
ncbi:MAG: DUF1015 domain-containing protein [Myxococcota bacterium]